MTVEVIAEPGVAVFLFFVPRNVIADSKELKCDAF